MKRFRALSHAWVMLLVLGAGCDGESPPTGVSPPPAGGWVKESGTITGANLMDAWPSPSGHVYVGSTLGELFRFDGMTWTTVPGPRAPIHALFGFSDRDMFAAIGEVAHFDGYQWTREPVVAGSQSSVLAVWGADHDTMFGAGSGGRVFRREGNHWKWQLSPTTRHLAAMWGSSSRQVYAVGQMGRIVGYDGASWQNVESNIDFDLNDVWGRSSDDIYAVGDRGSITHFDGRAWARVPTTVTDQFLAVWGDDEHLYISGVGSIFELAGDGLKPIKSVNAWCPAMAGSPRAGLVVGGGGGVTMVMRQGKWESTEQDEQTHYTDAYVASDGTLFVAGWGPPTGSFVRSRRGDELWSERATYQDAVTRLWAADHDHVFGLRNPGGISRMIGSAWDFLPVPGMEYPSSLYGFDQDHIVVVEDSLVYWFDGANWTTGQIAEGVRASDVWGTAPDSLFVTSYDGRVYAWNGLQWNLLEWFDTAGAVTGTSSHDVWVTDSYSLHHFDGQTWTLEQVDPGHNAYRVEAVAINDVFTLGWFPDGIGHVDEHGWALESTPPCARLIAIAGIPGSPVVAVGENGALLRLDR